MALEKMDYDFSTTVDERIPEFKSLAQVRKQSHCYLLGWKNWRGHWQMFCIRKANTYRKLILFFFCNLFFSRLPMRFLLADCLSVLLNYSVIISNGKNWTNSWFWCQRREISLNKLLQKWFKLRWSMWTPSQTNQPSLHSSLLSGL